MQCIIYLYNYKILGCNLLLANHGLSLLFFIRKVGSNRRMGPHLVGSLTAAHILKMSVLFYADVSSRSVSGCKIVQPLCLIKTYNTYIQFVFCAVSIHPKLTPSKWNIFNICVCWFCSHRTLLSVCKFQK